MNDNKSKTGPIDSSPPTSKDKKSIEWVYQNVMEYLDVGIIVLDLLENRVVYQNASAIALLKDEVDPESCEAICHLLLPQENGYTRIEGLEGQQTTLFGNRVMGYSVYTIAERTCFILLRDVTDKVRLMSIAEAVNTMDNIGYTFSGIRHEIGNPINSIKMTMSVLRRNLDRFPSDVVHEYIDRTISEIGRVEYLLKSLKNFSMFETPEIKPLDLLVFIEKFVQLVKSGLDKEPIRLQLEIPTDPVWVAADARALQQAMLNLLTNATAAMEDQPDPLLVISVQRRSKFVTVKVRDNGRGISREDQQHLFKPFYTTKVLGTGLGLVITRKLLAQMGCSIEIFSTEGSGTTVSIFLPWAKEKADAC
jgi:signal transduction histidine kinase